MNPQVVFDCFAEVNRIPRPSKREGKMIEFLKSFGESLGLPTKVDATGNVLISKPATAGMEGRPVVVLQSHMDMVCEKNADVEFNFDTDAIQTYVEGEWMHARGTTLGADDGIGVAMQMAVLRSTDIKHGPLECLFTVDEETGLTGAEGLQSDFMNGQYLINLDSEDEGQFFVSCAGGARTEGRLYYNEHAVPADAFCLQIAVKGLTGGHSGDDINKRRANANVLLVRFLAQELERLDYLYITDVQSGGLHNAIPREGVVQIVVPAAQKEQVRVDLNLFSADVEEEYHVTEPSLRFEMESVETVPATCLGATDDLLHALLAMPCGVMEMSQDVDGLVETSSNLASVRVVKHEEADEKQSWREVLVTTSQRSCIESKREWASARIRAVLELGGFEAVTNEGYPGWKVNPKSEIVRIAAESYRRLFNKEPQILAIHAGLECGLFSQKYPHLDMISMGPTLRGVHSPDERLHIPSVDLVWRHLLDVLQHV